MSASVCDLDQGQAISLIQSRTPHTLEMTYISSSQPTRRNIPNSTPRVSSVPAHVKSAAASRSSGDGSVVTARTSTEPPRGAATSSAPILARSAATPTLISSSGSATLRTPTTAPRAPNPARSGSAPKEPTVAGGVGIPKAPTPVGSAAATSAPTPDRPTSRDSNYSNVAYRCLVELPYHNTGPPHDPSAARLPASREELSRRLKAIGQNDPAHRYEQLALTNEVFRGNHSDQPT